MREMMGRRLVIGILAVLAAANLAVALWDFATGGFYFELYGLRISSWEVYKPLRNTLLCIIPALWLHDRAADPERTVWARLKRASPALAVAFALLWTVMAIVYGARAVSGSDSYGYVSEARLWASGQLVVPDKLASLAPLIGPAVAPLGYQLATVPGAIVPTYSPGLPLVMALAIKVTGWPGAVYYVVPLLGGLGIWLTYVLGVHAGRPISALFAAAAVGMSPIFLFEALHPMSDVPVTTWWLLAWVLAWAPGRFAPVGAGLATSMAVLTRPNLAPLAIVLVAVEALERPRLLRAALLAVAVVPGCLAIAAVNAHLYGSPLSSGYGNLGSLYAWSNAGPNLRSYATWIVDFHSPAILLALAAPFVAFSKRTWLMLAFSAGVLLSYVFYFVYDSWTYLRFLLPAIPLLLILAGIVIVALIERLPVSMRGVAAALVALIPISAEPLSAPFVMAKVAPGQQRFATVAEVVGRTLPQNAAVLSVVDSGTVKFYGQKATVRWELIAPDRLNHTIDVLRSHGYTPYILLQDFEEPVFRKRFSAASAIGNLDWPSAIEFFGQMRVKVYSVADRDAFRDGRDIARIAVPIR